MVLPIAKGRRAALIAFPSALRYGVQVTPYGYEVDLFHDSKHKGGWGDLQMKLAYNTQTPRSGKGLPRAKIPLIAVCEGQSWIVNRRVRYRLPIVGYKKALRPSYVSTIDLVLN
jgi:hypothetical protein